MSLLALAQGVAIDTDESSGGQLFNKRGIYTYEDAKKVVSDNRGTKWAVLFFDQKDCGGSILGKGEAGNQYPEPCKAIKDFDHAPDTSKIQSGAIYLIKDSGDTSSWGANLIEKGDKLSPCGVLNKVIGSGWIGGGLGHLPPDGWTCQNGKFKAYSVDRPGKD
ncbi:MAG: hypothetical protein M1812_001455 [Candelaria pacifica]|nr:MAG: hypothetical protein M1812_001455 [Candelaria pacifica]